MEVSQLIIGIPAYNEATKIKDVIVHLKEIGFHRIVVVDDGSQDETFEVAKKSGASVLRHPINCGAGAAVQTILTFGRKENWEYLLLMDADGQHRSEDIEKLMKKMTESGADLVIGDRFSHAIHNDVPKIKRMYNSLANILTNWFCKGSYSDTQSGFRMLNKKAIHAINLQSNGFGFCSEMIFKAEKQNLLIKEEGIGVYYTVYSRSKGQNNLLSGIKTAWQFLENM